MLSPDQLKKAALGVCLMMSNGLQLQKKGKALRDKGSFSEKTENDQEIEVFFFIWPSYWWEGELTQGKNSHVSLHNDNQ